MPLTSNSIKLKEGVVPSIGMSAVDKVEPVTDVKFWVGLSSGRTGMGGYSIHGINLPVCTAGTYNCMDKISEGSRPTIIVADGLFAILGKRMRFSYECVYEVADFLCHRP